MAGEQNQQAQQAQQAQPTSMAQKVIAEAKKYVDRGNPYVWGGKGQELTDENITSLEGEYGKSNYKHLRKGGDWEDTVGKPGYECVDCSGLTETVFQRVAGKYVGTGTASQIGYSKNWVKPKDALPGDLLVERHTNKEGKGVGHAAIMGDNGKIIEARGKDYGCVNTRTPEQASMQRAFHVVSDGDQVEVNQTQGDDSGSIQRRTSAGEVYDKILTDAQEQEAIKYNNEHNSGVCKQIQGIVGAYMDGSFGKATVNKIAKWQLNRNEEVTGKYIWNSEQDQGNGGEETKDIRYTSAGESYEKILTDAQEDAAIKYNRNHNSNICRKIQKEVGAYMDGSFGKATVNKIAKWQSERGEEVTGKYIQDKKDGDDAGNNGGNGANNGNVAGDADIAYTADRDVRYGASGEAVRALQTLLLKHGESVGSKGVDGDFGKGTATGLLRFQYHFVKRDAGVFFRKVYNDGKLALCDSETWAALRQDSPSAVNEPGKAIPFVGGKRDDEANTPRAKLDVGGVMSDAAAAKFNEMTKASGGLITYVSSTFRGMTDEATQAGTGGVGGSQGAIELYVDRGFDPASAAVPGESKHCSGNAVDVGGFASRTDKPKVWEWLSANASKYNFHPYDYETWHWNYY